jgi:hypothetical protein
MFGFEIGAHALDRKAARASRSKRSLNCCAEPLIATSRSNFGFFTTRIPSIIPAACIHSSTVRLTQPGIGTVRTTQVLLNDVARPAVAMRPERALRAHAPIWIIGSLFVRAADYMIRHYNRLGAVTPDEFKDRLRDRGIGPNIPVFGEPPLQNVRIATRLAHNPNCCFAGSLIIWSVERNSGDWVAPKTATGSFFQWRI